MSDVHSATSSRSMGDEPHYRSPVAHFRGEPNSDIAEVTSLVAHIRTQAGADLDRARVRASAGDASLLELAMASARRARRTARPRSPCGA
jgi:hypothetical protein